MVRKIPEGAEHLITHLVIAGAKDAIEFYKKAFGAEEAVLHPAPDGRVMHAELRLGESTFYVCDDFPEYAQGQKRDPKSLGASTVTIHRYVEDTDAALQAAVDAGATLTMPAMDMFWGDRYGKVTDPWGHEWSFATHVKDVTEEEMAKAAEAMFGA